jgi:hypothetical protein
MAESSIKIEVTGEAATALAKLPELLHGAIHLHYEKDQEREERREEREASAVSDRMDRFINILTILGNAAGAYFASTVNKKEDKGAPPEQESASNAILAHLRNDLCRLVPRTSLPTALPLDQVLQMLKYARPEWLPEDVVGRMYAIMRYCTDLRDAGDLLDALGEDTEVHREAIKVLDGALDLYEKRKTPGFMCMDCGARNIDVQTHPKECKRHEDHLEPGPDRPVSDMDFVIAVCSLVGLDANGSLHLTEALALALKMMSEWDGPLAWDFPDRKIDDALLAIDRYLSNPAPRHIREVLDRKDLSIGLDWLKEAALRLRYLDGDDIDLVDADARFISSVCRLAGLDGIAGDSLEGALRLLSTSIQPPVDPEPPSNVERVAEYLNARQYHPSITELLLRPDFKVAYDRLKGIAKQSSPEQESV